MNPLGSVKRAFRRATSGLATYRLPSNPTDGVVLAAFLAACRDVESPCVLELGTRRSDPTRSTRHDEWVPHASEYVGTDIDAGADVDLVADVHHLTDLTGLERYDVIISCSTFEHFKYPHLAAHEIMKALRVGGLLFAQTHQSFPEHGHPYDYFRYSREALAGLFGAQMGFRVQQTAYEYPARIHSPHGRHLAYGPAFLNVCLYGQKTASTPDEYVYELDTDM